MLERSALRFVSRTTGAGEMAWRVWPATRRSSIAIVLVHGSYGSWTHWLRNIAAWREVGTVLCADVPGFGDSTGAARDSAPDIIGCALADGVHACRQALHIRATRWIVGGFSLGAVYAGWIARHLADRREPFVPAGLLLVAPGGLGARPDRVLPLKRLPAHADARERREVHRHNLEIVMFGAPGRIDDLAVTLQERNVARARHRGPFAPAPDYLLRALSGTTTPILAIWGDRDAFDPDVTPRVRALLAVRPDARTHVVAGAGHWLGYEAAAEVNALVAAWVLQVSHSGITTQVVRPA